MLSLRPRPLFSFPSHEDGAVVVEVLIVLPLMLGFAMFVAEVLLLLKTELHAENAMRAGAHYLMRCETLPDGCNDALLQEIVTIALADDATTGPEDPLTITSVVGQRPPSSDPEPRVAELRLQYLYTGGALFSFGASVTRELPRVHTLQVLLQ